MHRVRRRQLLVCRNSHGCGVHSVCRGAVQLAHHRHRRVHRVPRRLVRRAAGRKFIQRLHRVWRGYVQRPQRCELIGHVYSLRRGVLQRCERNHAVHRVCRGHVQNGSGHVWVLSVWGRHLQRNDWCKHHSGVHSVCAWHLQHPACCDYLHSLYVVQCGHLQRCGRNVVCSLHRRQLLRRGLLVVYRLRCRHIRHAACCLYIRPLHGLPVGLLWGGGWSHHVRRLQRWQILGCKRRDLVHSV